MAGHVTHFTADWFTRYADEWTSLLGYMRHLPVAALEIGSYEGRSACWFMDNLLVHSGSHLTCVDSWDGGDTLLLDKTLEAELLFDANVAYYGTKVTKVKGRSYSVLSDMVREGRQFGLIFVDGSHEGYDALADLMLAWRLLAPGGWLSFDDYEWHRDELRSCPKDAWDGWIKVKPPGLLATLPLGRMMFAKKAGS